MSKAAYLGGRKLSILVSASILALSTNAVANDGDLTKFSLVDLMQMEVTTVSMRQELASDAAAAIFVLNRGDIERSGAATIPDALRLVPGVNVSQVNANSWAVTVRGFNSRFANKLLVLIDGRAVYTPLFSGVNWDRQNVILEDIERIEVIRGPGATLWGANAVNGVINIITRSSSDTQGTLIKASAGDDLESQIVLRHGGKLGESGTYRVHAKYEEFDSREIADGTEANDNWNKVNVGFRTDFNFGQTDSLTVSGEVAVVNSGETLDVPLFSAPFSERRDADIDRLAGHVLVQWSRDLGDMSELSVQGFVDYSQLEIPQGEEDRTTVDIQAQYSSPVGQVQNFLWGIGFRNVSDEIKASSFVHFDPNSRDTQIYNGFIQDTIQATEKLSIVLGSKFSHNDYTGFEIQPSARFLWKPKEGRTFWGAVSRAVRTPSRAEDNIRVVAQVLPPNTPGQNPTPFPGVVRFTGDPSIDSETLIAYELGARVRLGDNISLDATVFYNDYDNQRGSRIGTPFVDPVNPNGPVLVIPLTVDELVDATSSGVEVVADVQVNEDWRLQWTYSYLDINGDAQQGPGILAMVPGGSDPAHTLTIRSLMDVSDKFRFDTTLRYVSELDGFNIDGYTELDIRLAYRLTDSTELSVVGRNLLDDRHLEFGVDPSFATIPTQVERNFFASITKKF